MGDLGDITLANTAQGKTTKAPASKATNASTEPGSSVRPGFAEGWRVGLVQYQEYSAGLVPCCRLQKVLASLKFQG